jgi:signal transduction histidine kinase
MATALAVSDGNPTPAGTRVPIDAGTAYGRAITEGRAARIDDYSAIDGDIARIAEKHGIHAVVSHPIVVRGRAWGAMSVGWRDPEPLPPETETVVARFSDLVATAIANAEARAQVERLADEQAALRRVATLVAEGVPSAELFSGVTTEVAHVFTDVDRALVASVIRFDPGPESVLVGASREYEQEPLGARWTPKELYVSTRVLRTGRSARVDEADLDSLGGPDAEVLRLRGFLHQVGSPVVVDGRLWGAMCLNSKAALPSDTDARLESFTELVATAISNTESREELSQLAEEQAALRRVAELVARRVTPEEVFHAVAVEVSGLSGSEIGEVLRFEDDGMVTVLGATEGPHAAAKRLTPEVGERLMPDPGYGVHTVRETGHSARFDTDDPFAADMPPFVRSLGIRSAVASPVVVDGRLWGAIATVSLDRTLAPHVEHRLNEFTALVATAVANTHAREQLTTLADEQAALRRVATRVARGATPEDVFPAVAAEVGTLFGGDVAAIVRFEADGMATVLGDVGGPHNTGKRVKLDPGYVVHTVRETGHSARFDTDDPSSADTSSLVRTMGVRSAVASPIVVEGELWGAITAASLDGRLAHAAEQRLTAFTELVATAVANTQARDELTASRARIVAASDDARRRIERDLHDGAQQRLVSLGLELRMAAESVPIELPELDGRLEHVADEIDGVIDDLREMSRGIHPAVLSDGGLGPAIEMLALRATVPVELDLGPPARFTAQVEVATYYVVSEALTNTAKHANASRARVLVEERDGRVCVSIDDDGDGGAELEGGSGLAGLRDRVEALGGSFRLSSPLGQGTIVAVELPVAADDGPPAT